MGWIYKTVSVVVVLCLLLALGWLAASGSPDPMQTGGPPEPPAAAGGVKVAGDSPPAARRTRTEVPTPTDETPGKQLRGRVLDGRGAPLSGVPLRLHAYDVGRRRLDAPIDGMVGGRSDARGEFVLPCPVIACAPMAGAGFATLRSTVVAAADGPPDEILVVAAPSRRVEGKVIDTDGVALPGATIIVSTLVFDAFPLPLDPTFAPLRTKATSGVDGRFALDGVPISAGVKLVFIKPGFESRRLPATDAAQGWLQVTLERSVPNPERLRGKVLDALGRPVAGATVRFGFRQQTSTSELGEFEFDWLRRPARMVAISRGLQPAVRDGVNKGDMEQPMIRGSTTMPWPAATSPGGSRSLA